MDIRLPGANGLNLTCKLKSKYPDVIVAVFTNPDLSEYREKASSCGAKYCLGRQDSKACDIADIVSDIMI